MRTRNDYHRYRYLSSQQQGLMAVSNVDGESGSHGAVFDSVVTEFATYEDFLDSQITPTDLYYLEVSLTVILF